MASICIDIISSEEKIFSGKAKLLVLSTQVGELGILPGHIPLIACICPGMLKIVHAKQPEEYIFTAGGILEVQKESKVTVLVDTAIRASDLDEERSISACQKARQTLLHAKEKSDIITAEAELAILVAQVECTRKLRQKKATIA